MPITRLLRALGVLLLALPVSAFAAGAARRAPSQIVADLKAAEAAVPHYDMEGRLDPQYRHQMAKEVVPPLRRVVDLMAELEEAVPAEAAKLRLDHCFFLAELAVDGDADALQTLTDASHSAKPADALFGSVGLLEYRWWKSPTTETQTDVAAEFEKLAKANPREEFLVATALTMAHYHAASDDTANALRDIVEKDLHSAAAIKYQHQPNKFGRPFKVSVPIVGGKPLFIPSLKGKVVLLDFWATWCPPCRASLPHLVELYKQYHSQGLEVVGISNDYALTDLKEFLGQNKDMAWPQSFSPAAANQWHTLAKQCDVDGIPTSYLIDRNGILRNIQIGLPPDEMVQKYIAAPAGADGAMDKPSRN